MKFLMRTKKFVGMISVGRFVLYREAKPPGHEKIFDTVIPLRDSNITVKVRSDPKHDKRFIIAVETFSDGKRKDETYEVSLQNSFID